MVSIQNTDSITAIRDGARLSISEGFPTQLSNICMPVMDMTPDFHRKTNIVRTGTVTNGTTTTIYTTPTDRDFFLASCSLAFIKDVTATATYCSLAAYFDAVERNILFYPHLATTVQTGSLSQVFIPPLKVDRGTIIRTRVDTNNANESAYGTITGYTVDP